MQKEFYSEYNQVEDKHWWFVGRRTIFLHILDQLFAPRNATRRILDIGCGTGTMVGHLERYGSAQGIDADEEAVKFCKLRGLENVELLGLQNLPFEAATFGLVTMFDVLEHIDDDLHTLREIYRILQPGGTLMLSVPAYRFLWGNQDVISLHKRRYVASELRKKLTDTGFEIQRVSYFNTLMFPPIAAVRVPRSLLPKSKDEEVKSDFTMNGQGLLNTILGGLFSLESRLMDHCDLPFGVSILGLAKKPV